jgi:hypothetical protein
MSATLADSRRPPALGPAQRAALAAAIAAPLWKFRVGWAHSKAGPFHPDRAVQTLAARGLVALARRGVCGRPQARAIEPRRPA